MKSLIEVIGPRAQVQAEAIAKHYSTKAFSEYSAWYVECNEELEDAMCMDDEGFFNAIAEVEAATGVTIDANDICF